MAELSRQLLRKRAEHNEGMLSNLEEVTLHQQDLKRIENLDVYCRHLKILYLQNNLIEKMEGLTKLVELEYVNAAVNSIAKIEGLKRCESLNKLDLTLNFIELEDFKESMENLEWCPNFTELYLTGNPCTDWKNYRVYAIAKCTTLMRLDGDEVSKSERLTAKTRLKELEKELEIVGAESFRKKEQERKDGVYDDRAYTRESRWANYVEDQEKKAADEKKSKDNSMFKEYNEMWDVKTTKEAPVHNKEGQVRMFNQGGYDWKFLESKCKTKVSFSIKVPKFMDTSSLNVDVHPTYVRIVVKEKVTQIVWPDEMLVDDAKIERSSTTGELCVTCTKSNVDVITERARRNREFKEDRDKNQQLEKLKQEEQDAKTNKTHSSELLIQAHKEASYTFSHKDNSVNKEAFVPDFDEDDVPPLE